MIGIIGYGNIGKAIANGLYKSDHMLANKIIISNNSDEFYISNINSNRFKAVKTNINVVESSKIVFICVKPYTFRDIADQIKNKLKPDTILVSLAPNYNINELSNMFNHKKVVRFMPNTPMEVLEGTLIMSRNNNVDENDVDFINNTIKNLGSVFWVDEKLLKATIGIAGSASAFIYMLLESLGNGGVSNGLNKDLAYEIAAQTIKGAGEMYLQTRIHPAILKEQVCSPGGITIKGVQVLEEQGFRNAIIKAVKETNK